TSYVNTVTVQGKDNDNTPTNTATDTATVTYTDVAGLIDIAKSVSPGSVSEGGVGDQTVTYTYVVKNTSTATTDSITVTSLTDDKLPNVDLLAAFKAANGGSDTLAYGASVTFTASQTVAVGDVGDEYVNVVTVKGHDDDGDPVSDSASASVT